MPDGDVTKVLIALAQLEVRLIERITRVETQVSERTGPGIVKVAGIGAGSGGIAAGLVELLRVFAV